MSHHHTDPRILELIPHRPPFLWIDKILDLDTNKAITEKHIQAQETFFQGHYPNHPIMPGVLLCECVFQTAAILIAHQHKQSNQEIQGMPAVTRIKNVKFKQPVYPNSHLTIVSELVEELQHAYYMKGYINSNDQKVVQLDFTCTLIQKQS